MRKRTPPARKGAKPKSGINAKVEITEAQWKVLGDMAEAMCTEQEMADYIGVSRRTFDAPHIRERFMSVVKTKKAATKWKVRKRQLEHTEDSRNIGGSVWWGKQHLAQKDRAEATPPEGGALEAIAGAQERLVELLDRLSRNKAQDA